MTNPAALDEPTLDDVMEFLNARKTHWADFERSYYSAIEKFLLKHAAIVKAVEGGEKALVPVEPTEEMEDQADPVFHEIWQQAREAALKRFGKEAYASVQFSVPIYKAMLRAHGIDALIKGD